MHTGLYNNIQPSHVFYVKPVLPAIISLPLFPPLLKQETSRRMTPLMQNLFLTNQKKHPTQCNDNHPPRPLVLLFAHHRKGGHEGWGVQYVCAGVSCG